MYMDEVVRVAANVPMGMDFWVSFNDAERFDPAMIPVTAGKKRPTRALEEVKRRWNKVKMLGYAN